MAVTFFLENLGDMAPFIVNLKSSLSNSISALSNTLSWVAVKAAAAAPEIQITLTRCFYFICFICMWPSLNGFEITLLLFFAASNIISHLKKKYSPTKSAMANKWEDAPIILTNRWTLGSIKTQVAFLYNFSIVAHCLNMKRHYCIYYHYLNNIYGCELNHCTYYLRDICVNLNWKVNILNCIFEYSSLLS